MRGVRRLEVSEPTAVERGDLPVLAEKERVEDDWSWMVAEDPAFHLLEPEEPRA